MNEEEYVRTKKHLGALAVEDAFEHLSEGETLWAPCIGTEYRLNDWGDVLGRMRSPDGTWSEWTVRDCMSTVLVKVPAVPRPLCATCRRTAHEAGSPEYSCGREGEDGMQYVEAIACDVYGGTHRALDKCDWYVKDDRKAKESDRKESKRKEMRI